MNKTNIEQQRALLLCDKFTDEEIDFIYGNPGVAKYVLAFAKGKTVMAYVSQWFQAKNLSFFNSPQVSKYPWKIIHQEETNGIE